ncbi:NADH-cytochrome b5 reductase 2 [Coniosporium apollinis CBS 100218]|uniref:NADH-cytochrome b5 reductase n=1 Tax=Coniosporium apollinis (strain CBS 100218) TaxID=1168221 RepID=R7YYU7_CONA1|nr:NADH-cytochrome b5 reductase 2 [Coniosporium apollinis CBS 100218]EON67090.1 NADH-cytochrome b5 reductase 2 [Coniosporium apollinis CBS 100218]
MFARQVFRPAHVLKNHVRRYATEPPQSSNRSAALFGGIAAAAGAGAYYYMNMGDVAPRNKERLGDQSAAQGSPSSRREEENIPAKAEKPMMAFKGGDQGFISLKLESVEDINHNTKRFRFKLPEEDSVSGLHVASAVIAKYKGPEMEKPAIRPYTPVSDEDTKNYMDFVIKRYPDGPMSEHLHSMNPGQRLDFKGPIPKYPWEPNKHDHIALVAGGTGITPMYQLARAIFKNPEDKTKVTLVFGNIAEEDVLLKREWDELENTYPQRFRAFYTLDKPPEDWQQGKGFITKELLKTVLPEPKEKNVKVFVCGPPGLYKAVSGTKKSPQDQGELEGHLKDLGYSKDQVYKF